MVQALPLTNFRLAVVASHAHGLSRVYYPSHAIHTSPLTFQPTDPRLAPSPTTLCPPPRALAEAAGPRLAPSPTRASLLWQIFLFALRLTPKCVPP